MFDIDTDSRLNKYKDSQIIVRLLKYAIPYLPAFILTLVLMLISVGFALVEPYIIGQAIDQVIGTSIDFPRLFIYLGIFVGAVSLSALFNYLQTIILQKTGQSIIYNIREEIFTHLEFQDIEYFNKVPTGKLVTRVTNDTNTLNEMYTSVIVSVFRNLFMLIGILTVMFILNASLTLLVLIVVPFIVIFSFVFRRFSRKAYRTVRTNMSRLNGFLAEHLSGMKIVQIFNQEESKYNAFNEQNTKLKKSFMRELLVFAIYRPTMYLLYMIATIIIFYFGGISVLEGVITVGMLIAFHQYLGRFFEPIQQLAEQFNILQSAFASSERIFAILDSHPNVLDVEDAITLDDVKGEIEFRNVWFAYKGDEWVLRDVSFKVNAKESVAFVGATGAGKTTILALLTRNYDIQKGDIFLDGINIKNIKMSSLRSFIGQMLQDVFMFSGTVASNIKLRSEDITDEEMIESCKYVNAHRFIEKLPKKYDEKVRERGNNFSAGQRQLMSFARTLVHKPRIMILDEATSNIDTETEQLIQESLKKMMNIGTMLIVAHRLSTIQHVDQIIVLQLGKIIEKGSHQELLKQKGHYHYLYQLQYQDQEA
ncbi:ABC transporter ATP-binding protein [Liberiplasma polymorphum]|uniref:ABC transporter ATP-binding protein n=1 Tax=Liberiplasma polymorphum TaxID=3374570 RepID=UPI0037757ACD